MFGLLCNAQHRLAGRDRIGLQTGQVVAQRKMAQPCDLKITAEGFAFRRNRKRSAQAARRDGLSVLRTSLPASDLGTTGTLRACRSFQTVDLKIWPSPATCSACACSVPSAASLQTGNSSNKPMTCVNICPGSSA